MKMKNLIIAVFGFSILALQSCSIQNYMETAAVNDVVEQSAFSFNANSAVLTNYDVINAMNSIPGATSSKITTLDSGYGLDLNGNLLTVSLPYFGRLYSASYGDPSKNSFMFESKDFTVTKSKNKKGSWIIKINVKDKFNSPNFILEVFKNGRAYLSVNANDRQPISYDGFISDTIQNKN